MPNRIRENPTGGSSGHLKSYRPFRRGRNRVGLKDKYGKSPTASRLVELDEGPVWPPSVNIEATAFCDMTLVCQTRKRPIQKIGGEKLWGKQILSGQKVRQRIEAVKFIKRREKKMKRITGLISGALKCSFSAQERANRRATRNSLTRGEKRALAFRADSFEKA